MFLKKLLLFVFLFSSFDAFSQWKKNDGLGTQKFCTKNLDDTCHQITARTNKIKDCHYTEDGEPTKQDWDNLALFGVDAQGWTCAEKDAWLFATELITYASIWGGACTVQSMNPYLTSIFIITGAHALVIEKVLSRVPCEAVKTSKHDQEMKKWVCDLLNKKNSKITCKPSDLIIDR